MDITNLRSLQNVFQTNAIVFFVKKTEKNQRQHFVTFFNLLSLINYAECSVPGVYNMMHTLRNLNLYGRHMCSMCMQSRLRQHQLYKQCGYLGNSLKEYKYTRFFVLLVVVSFISFFQTYITSSCRRPCNMNAASDRDFLDRYIYPKYPNSS